jgi:hypothetical protein
MFIMHLAAAIDANINDSKEYYMITSKEIYNLFKNLSPDNLGSNDFTNNDNDDLLKDTSSISDLHY